MTIFHHRPGGTTFVAFALVALTASSPASMQPAHGSVQRPQQKPATELPPLTEVAPDGLTRALASGELSEARYALERARSLFRPQAVARRFDDVGRVDPRSATMILRDLALRQDQLASSERRHAARVLARPTQPGTGDPSYDPHPAANTCATDFCIHWADSPSSAHAPPLEDSDANGLPDWIDTVVETFAHVVPATTGEQESSLGYQVVKSDAASADPGPNGLPDIYLADIGASGLYGYCTTDDPNAENFIAYGAGDFSAYCVIDNDYATDQFPNKTPIENLQITAAHEFFHAVQFGYDATDDLWFLESTAAWVEDELYDDVDDNYFFLLTSAVTYPDFPIDTLEDGQLADLRYGGWLFFRFLTEYIGSSAEPEIVIVREMWERAAWRKDHPEDPDDYSVQAIVRVLADRGFDLPDSFGDFHMHNWAMENFYEEGWAYRQFLSSVVPDGRPWITEKHTLRKGKLAIPWKKLRIDHLSAHNIMLRGGKGARRSSKLKLKIDGPHASRAPEARFALQFRSGATKIGSISLNGKGIGIKKLNFNKRKIRAVTLILVNASTRYEDCFTGSPYACNGHPEDDKVVYKYKARMKR